VIKLALKDHFRSRLTPHTKAVSNDKYTFVYAAPIHSLALHRRGGMALTASWSSRWRRPPARSWAGYRPDKGSCGHARHEWTNTACRSFHAFCDSLNGRHCNRHYMYMHCIEITSFIHYIIHTFLPHSILEVFHLSISCIYWACTTVWNHHVIVQINTFTWWKVCIQVSYALSLYTARKASLCKSVSKRTNKQQSLWHRHALPTHKPKYPFLLTRSGKNMYLLTRVSVSSDSLCSMLWAYRSISRSMHRYIDISIEHVKTHAMQYAHALLIVQINAPVDMTNCLARKHCQGIYCNDSFLLKHANA